LSNYRKDPDGTLDFSFDWSKWLATDETIIGYTVTVSMGLTKESDSESAGIVTVWLSGGTATTWYTVACKIVTNAGRTDERTMNILVLDR
jgi:hypothetical protein